MQAHQCTTQRGELTARDGNLVGEQTVLDRVHPRTGLAQDVHEHSRLFTQQMSEELGRGSQVVAFPNRGAQAVNRAQRSQTRADDQARLHAQHQSGNARRVEARVEEHVVNDCDQRIILHLESRRADAFVQGFVVRFRKLEVLAHPPLGGGIGERKVQPDERRGRQLRLLGQREKLERGIAVDGLGRLARGEPVAPYEPALVRAVPDLLWLDGIHYRGG